MKNKNAIFLFFILLFSTANYAQVTVELTVNNATIETTCGDLFGQPDPIFEVNVNGEPWVTYPQEGACFNALPNLQYQASYNCIEDIPLNVNVCFKVFENDGILPCSISESCSEFICQNFPLPIAGNGNYNLTIPLGGGSSGTLDFGINLNGLPLNATNDLPCNAYALGTIPLDGSISLPEATNNYCADGTGDPAIINFGSQNSVYFSFSPPPTGHVLIEGFSSTADEIGLQIAAYSSSDNICNGTFQFLAGSWTPADLDETLELTCLDPDLTYWILVDGEFVYGTGIFDLTISDAGNITPETTDTYVLCAGETLTIGVDVYDTSGFYSDTLPIGGGCIEIINYDLTILEEIVIDLQLIEAASDENVPDGQAVVSATGGDGDYFFTWSGGITGATQDDLIGGQNYCVTVVDGNNCSDVICMEIPFIDFILPTIVDGAATCNGDADGTFSFFVQNGMPPYTYTWTGNGLNGNGNIAAEMELVLVNNLPAGTYTINVADNEIDTTFIATITEPEVLIINDLEQTNTSCFGACDASLGLEAVGGTPPYSYLWTNGNGTENLQNLCAGTYGFTVTDANNCVASAEYLVTEPEEFIAIININNNVTCFAGSDASATVSTNGTPLSYLWDNGNVTETINDVSAGDYSVLVTNQDGCQATAMITIEEPEAPVGVTIDILTEITCNSSIDGMLRANATGSGNTFTYEWSNGMTGSVLDNLPAGDYTVTVSNEVNCSSEANITITEPTEIELIYSTENITCIGGENSGVLLIESVSGGEAPYSFSLDGENFNETLEYTTLAARNYTLYLEDGLGCLKTYDFSILPPPELFVNLGEDQEILLGETIDLIPTKNSDDLLYTWTSSEILEDCQYENCTELTVQPLNTSTYNLAVVDSITFCTASTSVNIIVNKTRYLFFPTAFSPDNDGINDKFLIYGQRAVMNVNYMHIFDRYGAQIYSIQDFMPEENDAGWDGTYKGKELPTGVYTWMSEILFIDGETEMYGGSVTILK